MPSVMHRA